jgi:hypothetical protein
VNINAKTRKKAAALYENNEKKFFTVQYRKNTTKQSIPVSISNKTVSVPVQLNKGCESTHMLARRVQILSEKLNHGREVRGH